MSSLTLEWSQFWGVCAQTDEKARGRWYMACGFWIEHDNVYLDPALKACLDNCSVSELAEFISGAPLPLAKIFIHKLTPTYKAKVMKNFRREDHIELESAYKNPPKATK